MHEILTPHIEVTDSICNGSCTLLRH